MAFRINVLAGFPQRWVSGCRILSLICTCMVKDLGLTGRSGSITPKVADSKWSLCNRGQPIVEVHRSICRGKIMVSVLEKHG